MGDTLDGLLARLASESLSPRNVVAILAGIAKRDDQETILRGTLSDGQDPLNLLSPAETTLQYLFILSTRLSSTTNAPLLMIAISRFTQSFDPTQARYAPERVTKLAKAIVKFSESIRNPQYAIEPLYNLITRYPPSVSFLTTIHPIFLLSCVQGQHFAAALPILSVPITEIDRSLSDLDYNDNIVYHYLGGVAYGALKRYAEAEEFLEIAVSSPAQAISAVQLEAYKKLILIQLIRHGRTIPPPKYTYNGLTKHIKGITQYATIVRHYPTLKGPLQEMVTKEANFFAEEGNAGLIRLVIQHAPRWALKNLMNTYLSLSLDQVVSSLHLAGVDEARSLVLLMIENGELSATLSPDGTLTFLDENESNPSLFSPHAIEGILRQAQESERGLTELNRAMISRPDLLSKALRERDQGSSFIGPGSGVSYDDENEMWKDMGSGQGRVDALFDS